LGSGNPALSFGGSFYAKKTEKEIEKHVKWKANFREKVLLNSQFFKGGEDNVEQEREKRENKKKKGSKKRNRI